MPCAGMAVLVKLFIVHHMTNVIISFLIVHASNHNATTANDCFILGCASTFAWKVAVNLMPYGSITRIGIQSAVAGYDAVQSLVVEPEMLLAK